MEAEWDWVPTEGRIGKVLGCPKADLSAFILPHQSPRAKGMGRRHCVLKYLSQWGNRYSIVPLGLASVMSRPEFRSDMSQERRGAPSNTCQTYVSAEAPPGAYSALVGAPKGRSASSARSRAMTSTQNPLSPPYKRLGIM